MTGNTSHIWTIFREFGPTQKIILRTSWNYKRSIKLVSLFTHQTHLPKMGYNFKHHTHLALKSRSDTRTVLQNESPPQANICCVNKVPIIRISDISISCLLLKPHQVAVFSFVHQGEVKLHHEKGLSTVPASGAEPTTGIQISR